MAGRVRFAVLAASIVTLSACGGTSVPLRDAPMTSMRTAVIEQPSSAVHAYFIGDGSSNAFFVQDLQLGADGRLFYTLAGSNATSGEIGWFNPRSHTQSFAVTNGYQPAFISETADGSVWVSEYNNA